MLKVSAKLITKGIKTCTFVHLWLEFRPVISGSLPLHQCIDNCPYSTLVALTLDTNMDLVEKSLITTKHHGFKNPNRPPIVKRNKAARQLLSDEQKYLQSKLLAFDTPTYPSIAAPPSLLPQKHYCDITGLEGKYKSPTNRLRFHNVEIYTEVIKNMSPSADQEYLELRGANVVLK